MSVPEMSRDAFQQGLVLVVRNVRKQNEWLLEQNKALQESNAFLHEQNKEMAKYCSSISGLGDAVVKLNERVDCEREKGGHVADSLIMLWGQLAANGVVTEQRQRCSPGISAAGSPSSCTSPSSEDVSPAAPVKWGPGEMVYGKDYGVTDLWCNDDNEGGCKPQ